MLPEFQPSPNLLYVYLLHSVGLFLAMLEPEPYPELREETVRVPYSSVPPAAIWSHASKGGVTQKHCAATADPEYYPRYPGTPDATLHPSESLRVTRLSSKAGSDVLISGPSPGFSLHLSKLIPRLTHG